MANEFDLQTLLFLGNHDRNLQVVSEALEPTMKYLEKLAVESLDPAHLHYLSVGFFEVQMASLFERVIRGMVSPKVIPYDAIYDDFCLQRVAFCRKVYGRKGILDDYMHYDQTNDGRIVSRKVSLPVVFPSDGNDLFIGPGTVYTDMYKNNAVPDLGTANLQLDKFMCVKYECTLAWLRMYSTLNMSNGIMNWSASTISLERDGMSTLMYYALLFAKIIHDQEYDSDFMLGHRQIIFAANCYRIVDAAITTKTNIDPSRISDYRKYINGYDDRDERFRECINFISNGEATPFERVLFTARLAAEKSIFKRQTALLE